MAVIESWFVQERTQPVKVRYLDGNVFSMDNNGNLIGIEVLENGEPFGLSGSVSASVIRADGATVAVYGTLSGNKCSVILPQACYAIPGVISIVIKLTSGSDITTVGAIVGNVYQSRTDAVVDPGEIIPDIAALISAIEAAVASIPADYSSLWTSLAPAFDTSSTYKVGQYVTYNGGIYEFVNPHPAGSWNPSHVATMPVGNGLFAMQNIFENDIDGSISEYNNLVLYGLTLGKTLSSGTYADAASAVTTMRAASPMFFESGNYIKIVPLTGYKVEIDFYNDAKTYVGYKGWITTEQIIKPLGKYFRILVGGDADISGVYESIASVYTQGNLYDMNRRVDWVNSMYGGEVELPAWIEGKFPNWTNGQIWDNAEYKYSPKIRVVSGAKYRYTGIMNSVCGIIFYDETGTIIAGAGINTSEFIAPAGAYYADIGTRDISSNPHLYFCAEAVEIENGKSRELELTQLPGVINTSLVVNDDTGARVVLNVTSGEQYRISSYCYIANTYPIIIFLDGETVVSYENLAATGGSVSDALIVIPDGVNKMIVNGKPLEIIVKRVVTELKEAIGDIYSQIGNLNTFEGKTIVWFGTSIPANGWFGYEHPMSYPQRVGRLLGANVINEAIGSSCVHCKDPARISEDNPYGFKSGFESTSRCLSNSLDEANWIIDHWNSDIWTSGVPSEMTDWLKGKIRSFGYEEKIDKYLTESTFPDLFVFDHGYNDSSDVNNYYETYGRYNLYCFRGAMNFLIKRILDYNPEANIVIIGNYTTTRDVPQMQDTVAKDWAIPICKQWEQLGLTQTEYVTCEGYWHLNNDGDYEWIEDGTPRQYTIKDRLIPDGIHPHSNPTGIVNKKMAQNLAKWFLANVPMYD